MFSEKVITQKLLRFKEKYSWTPVRHTLAEIEKAKEYILSLCETDAKGAMFFDDKNWSPTLVRFVQNERAMCSIDCEYFLSRYFKIAADNRIINFSMRAGQKAFYRVVQELEAAGKSIEIQVLKARQQGLCLDPSTRILTSDLRWLALNDITVGQEVLGIDEFPPGGTGPSRKMRRSTVLAKSE